MEHVDVTGEVCPRPALIVRDRLAELEAGDTLVVEGDYPPAEQNLRRTCTNHGFAVEGGNGEGYEDSDGEGAEGDDKFELRITVTDDAAMEG